MQIQEDELEGSKFNFSFNLMQEWNWFGFSEWRLVWPCNWIANRCHCLRALLIELFLDREDDAELVVRHLSARISSPLGPSIVYRSLKRHTIQMHFANCFVLQHQLELAYHRLSFPLRRQSFKVDSYSFTNWIQEFVFDRRNTEEDF